jgi:hypothetical protein
MSHENTPTPPEREVLRGAVQALPVVAGLGAIGMRETLAIFTEIRSKNHELYEQIRQQIRANQHDWHRTLEGTQDEQGNYVLPRSAVNAIVARSVIAGAAQTTYGIGEAMAYVQLLQDITGMWQPESDTETGPETGPETDTQGENEA